MKRLALCVLMSASLVMNSVTAFAYDYSIIREESSSQVYDSAKFYIDSHLPKLVGMEDSNGLGTGLVNYVNLYSYTGNVALYFLRKESGNSIQRVVFPSNPSSGAFIGSANSLTVSRESLLDSSSSNYTPAINAYFYWDNEYAENKMDVYDKLIFNTGSSYKFVSVPVSNTESTDSIEIKNTTINTLDGSEAVNRVADSDIKANELVGDIQYIPVGVPVSVYNKYLTEQSADSDITLYKVIVHRNSDKTKGVSVSVDNRGILSVGNNESLGENNSIGVDIEYIYKFKDGSDLYNKYGKLGSATKTVSVYKDYPTMYRENDKEIPFYGDYRGVGDKYFYMNEHLNNLFVNGYLGSTKTVREADNSFVNSDEHIIHWTIDDSGYRYDYVQNSGLDISKIRTMQAFLNQTDKNPVVKITPEAVNASEDSLYMKGQYFTSFSDEFTKISTITYRGSVFTYAFETAYGKNNANSVTVKEMTRDGGQAIQGLFWDDGLNTSGLKYGENKTKPSDSDNSDNLALLSGRIKDEVKAKDYEEQRLVGWSVYSINYDDRVALAYAYLGDAYIGGVPTKIEYVMGIPLDTAIMKIEPVEVSDMELYKYWKYDNGKLSESDREKIGAMLTRLNGGDWWKFHTSGIPDRATYDNIEDFWYVNVNILHRTYKIQLTGGKIVRYRDSYTVEDRDNNFDSMPNPYIDFSRNINDLDFKYGDREGLSVEYTEELASPVKLGKLKKEYLVNLKTRSGKTVKENVPVRYRVSIAQSQFDKYLVELPKSLKPDEEVAKTAVTEIEEFLNNKYDNAIANLKDGDSKFVGVDTTDNYPTVTVRYNNGFTEEADTDRKYKFIESPIGEVYVDGDAYESGDTSAIQEEALKVLAKYLDDNGDSLDNYSDFSVNSLDGYSSLNVIEDGKFNSSSMRIPTYYTVTSKNSDDKQKTFTFTLHPSVDLIDSIDTDFMVGAERELTKEEYSEIVSIASSYGLMNEWFYPELSNAKYEFVPVSDELAKVTVYTNLDKYGYANGKFTIQLKFTGFPQDKDLYDSFELDTDLVVSGSNLVHNDSDDWEAWGRPKPACPKTKKIITEVPAKPVEEPEKPKVSDNNIPKVSDSNIPKKHEPKRDKPSPKENVEPKVPNDRDYPRENDPKDPTVITYIPQGNGGTEELFKKDGSVNGTSIEKEQEEERIRQEMLDNELKAKNMKENTRGAVKTADTRHMILMFAMFMGSAVLFAITILAKKKYEDNIG